MINTKLNNRDLVGVFLGFGLLLATLPASFSASAGVESAVAQPVVTGEESTRTPTGPSGKLVVLTSYPKVLTDAFRRAFEMHYPAVQVDVIRKKTGVGVDYLKETREQNTVDLFWVSAPDAMETLKKMHLLERYSARSPGLPNYISGYPVHDPEGFYSGFAASGYGIMWNERYVEAKGLAKPTEWEVLASPEYRGHVGMSSASRSGTTHLAVETILQGYGWQKGWDLVRAIGGNLVEVTKGSSDVPKGVETGQFAAGIVVDFYGLSAQARHHPVNFAYPKIATILPANVALVKNGPNPQAAKAFIQYLLAEEGQSLLLEPEIRRLPLRPEIYDRAPDDFPNPFKDANLKRKLKFDVALSEQRYRVVNALFDVVVTFNLDELKAATGSIQLLRARLKDNKAAPGHPSRQLLSQAENLLNFTPVSEVLAKSASTAAVLKKKRKKADDPLEGEQARLELGWQATIRKNYQQARELADAGLVQLSGVSRAPVGK